MRPQIFGKIVDSHTRCIHYHSPTDIIAIKFKCCGRYYPCHICHEEGLGHTAVVWPRAEWNQKAVLCGNCDYEMSINEYMACDNRCPSCQSEFNPNCSLHYHLYFES